MELRSDQIKRKPNLDAGEAAAESVHVLFVTADLREADYLASSLRKAIPTVSMDFSPGIRSVAEQIHSGRFDIVLIDNKICSADRMQLVTLVQQQEPQLSIVLIFGRVENDPMIEFLITGADDSIIRGPNFTNDLQDVLHRVFVRNRLGLRRRVPVQHTADIASNRIRTRQPGSAAADEAQTDSIQDTGDLSQGIQRGVDDLRSSPRYQIEIDCRMVWCGQSHTGCIRDLSEGGAFLETTPPPPVGETLTIYFSLMGASLSLDASVIHEGWYLNAVRNFYGCGIRFDNLTEETKNLLKQAIQPNSQPAIRKTMLEP